MAAVNAEAVGFTQNTLTRTFVVNKKPHEVILEWNVIKWRKLGKDNTEYQSIVLDNVLSVATEAETTPTGDAESGSATASGQDTISVSSTSSKKTQHKQTDPHITIHYVNKTPKYLWKHETIKFYSPDLDVDLTSWVSQIQGYITNPGLHRPKRLLVFVNPQSGGSNGVQIYEKKAAPLFKLAGVQTDVTITQNGEHTGQILSECNLDGIDGAVAVGGDGSFLLVFDSLLRRVAKEAGIDLDDVKAEPVRPNIPVGLIPAGTGQGISKGLTNTTDPVTATLHIILGERHHMHMNTSHNNGKLLSFGCMLAAHGIFADAMRAGEEMRYLGRARYLFAMGKSFSAKRSFKARIEYRLDPTNEDPCKDVSASPSEDQSACVAEPSPVWESLEGSFCSIHMFMMDLTQIKKAKEKRFVPKDPNINTIYLYWATSECSRTRFIKSFVSLMIGDSSGADDHYIGFRQVKEYRMILDVPELNEKTSCWHIDGELNALTDKTLHVRSHANLLPVFGAGIYKLFGLDKLLEAAQHAEPVTEL